MLATILKLTGLIPMGAAAAPIGLIVDLILRLIPSEKPRGVLHYMGAVVKGLGSLFSKLAELSDSILPQNLK